jgi:RNA recognition motif-containing protein
MKKWITCLVFIFVYSSVALADIRITNLSLEVKETDLQDGFGPWGKISSISLTKSRDGKTQNAIISWNITKKEEKDVVKAHQGINHFGHWIHLSIIKPAKEKQVIRDKPGDKRMVKKNQQHKSDHESLNNKKAIPISEIQSQSTDDAKPATDIKKPWWKRLYIWVKQWVE